MQNISRIVTHSFEQSFVAIAVGVAGVVAVAVAIDVVVAGVAVVVDVVAVYLPSVEKNYDTKPLFRNFYLSVLTLREKRTRETEIRSHIFLLGVGLRVSDLSFHFYFTTSTAMLSQVPKICFYGSCFDYMDTSRPEWRTGRI